MAKPKISTDWLADCSGCHMSLLDMDERIIDLVKLADIRATPITDLKEPDKEGVDVGVLSGAINNTANVEVAKRMRSRCKCLVALGDCAVFGGIIAMRNFFPLEESLRRAYVESESSDAGSQIPHGADIAKPLPVQPLQEVVKVDLSVPGCPPNADTIYYVLSELAQGRMPEIKDDTLQWN